MKKLILILMDGMSLEMMKLPELVDLSFLKKTDLQYIYPECIKCKDIWKIFGDISFLDASVDRFRTISSADQAVMLSSGFSKNYIDLNWDNLDLASRQLFQRLNTNSVKIASLTNMPITDSTVGMFLKANEVNTYNAKKDISKISYTNINMQHNIAEQLLNLPWDLLIGGGRMFFYPENMEDPVSKGEYGTRTDGLNLLEKFNKSYVNLLYENTYSVNKIDWSYKKNLVLLNHRDFAFEAERIPTNAKEPRLSDLGLDIIYALNETRQDWILLLESGKVDPAAHNNNAYYVLGEILEIYRFLYKLSTRKDWNQYTVIFTSDHATGGLSLCDSYDLPYDGFKQGITWGIGPGKNRYDRVEYISKGKKQILDPFTNEYKSKQNFHSQPSALINSISLHSRDVVPFLISGPQSYIFKKCQTHAELYYKILQFYGIQKTPVKKGNLWVVVGNCKNNDNVCHQLFSDKKYAVINYNAYLLNHLESDEVMDIVMENLMFDCKLLLINGDTPVVNCEKLRKQDIHMLEKHALNMQIHILVMSQEYQNVIRHIESGSTIKIYKNIDEIPS